MTLRRLPLLLALLLPVALAAQQGPNGDERTFTLVDQVSLAAGTFTTVHQENVGYISSTHNIGVIAAGASTLSISITPCIGVASTSPPDCATPVTATGTTTTLTTVSGIYDFYNITITWTGTATSVKLHILGTHASASGGGLKTGAGPYVVSAASVPPDGCVQIASGQAGSTGLPCGSSGGNTTSAALTTNKLSKATGPHAIGDSSISDDGTTVTIPEPVVLSGSGPPIQIPSSKPTSPSAGTGQFGTDASGNVVKSDNGAAQVRVTGVGTPGTLNNCPKFASNGVDLVDSGAACGGSGAVTSVFGRTAVVVAVSGDYTVAQVTGAAPLASPTFTGTPAAPTPSPGDNTTKLATTQFVTAAVAAGGSFTPPTGNGFMKVASGAMQTSGQQIGVSDFFPNSYIAGAGSVNALTATMSPAATALTTGLQVYVLPNLANTATNPTLNINGLGAVTIMKSIAGTISALVANDYVTTIAAHFFYDGTRMILLNPQTAAASGGISSYCAGRGYVAPAAVASNTTNYYACQNFSTSSAVSTATVIANAGTSGCSATFNVDATTTNTVSLTFQWQKASAGSTTFSNIGSALTLAALTGVSTQTVSFSGATAVGDRIVIQVVVPVGTTVGTSQITNPSMVCN